MDADEGDPDVAWIVAAHESRQCDTIGEAEYDLGHAGRDGVRVHHRVYDLVDEVDLIAAGWKVDIPMVRTFTVVCTLRHNSNESVLIRGCRNLELVADLIHVHSAAMDEHHEPIAGVAGVGTYVM